MSGGATVSFDHNLAGKIEKLIIGDTPREKIIAQVRTGIYTVILLRRIERHAVDKSIYVLEATPAALEAVGTWTTTYFSLNLRSRYELVEDCVIFASRSSGSSVSLP
jgi:hypothetical protein